MTRMLLRGGRNLVNLLLLVGLGGQLQAQAVRTGFSTVGTQSRSDDTFSGPIAIGFPINFFGTTYSNLYVGTNGYVTFDSGQTGYDPQNLINYQQKVIAPFYGDIDTRNASSGQISWGSGTVNGRAAFAVTWNNVGYYNSRADKTNTFQLVLINRSDRGTNDFDFEFNYNQIQWEAGNVNGGSNGICSTGCEPPTVGFSNGLSGTANRSFEQQGSHTAGAFLDTNTNTGLKYRQSGGSGVNGRLLFNVSNGAVSGGNQGGSGFCSYTGGAATAGISLLDGPVCTTTALVSNTCVVNRPAAVTAFSTSDPFISVWFGLAGLTPTSTVRARFSFNGVEQPSLDYGPFTGFQSNTNYYLCPTFIPAPTGAGNWTLAVTLNNSATPFMTVSFTVGTGSGGGGGGGGTTGFGTSCAGSFPGLWNTNIVGDTLINPQRSDGFFQGSGRFNWNSTRMGNGFVLGRVLTGYTDGGVRWGRWLMAPSGTSMLGAPRGFNSGASVAPSATRSAQSSTAAVPCVGTGTAALWVGQWETTPFGLIRGRLNLDGSVTLVLPQDCDFPGGTFTGTASGLTLSGTYAGPGGAGTFSISLGSSDITNFSGTFTVGSAGPKTFTGTTRDGALNSDFLSDRGFQGRWYTPYGLLTLKVTGTTVAGTYPNGGTITGTVSQGGVFTPPSFGAGITLTGTYSDSTGSGTISLKLNGVASPPDAFPEGGYSHFFGSSVSSTGATLPWTGARAGDWSGTWSTELGTMTIAQRGDGKWVGRVGGYTFVGNTTDPKAGGNAWSGQWIGPFGGGGFSSLLNQDGVSFSLSVAGYSHLGYYATLHATHTSDAIGTLDLCSTINPVTTITTVPSGLQVQVDSATVTAPVTRNYPAGQYHGFGTTTPQILNGVQYNFALWNYTRGLGGGVLAPPSSTTYTAVFTSSNAGAGPGGLGGFWDSPVGQIWIIPGAGNTVNGLFPGGGPGGYSGFTCTVNGNTCTGTAFTPNGPPGTITITTSGPTLTGTVTRPGNGGTIPFTGTVRGPSTAAPASPEVNNGPVMTSAHQSTCAPALPSPIRPSFFTSDPNITHWVSLNGVPVGASIGVAYTGPGGVRYAGTTTANWADLWVCYTLPVSPVAAPQGSWSVVLSVNGQVIPQSQVNFTLTAGGDATGGGGGGGSGTGTPVSGQNPGSSGTGGGGNGGGGNGGGGGTGGGTSNNLLCNGSFEQPGGGHIFNILPGNTIIPCWNIVSGNVDYITPTFGFTASDGVGFMDLDGSTPGAMAQTFTTTPNTQYTLTFDLAGTPGYGAAVKQVQITAAGQSTTRTFDQTGKTPTAMGWQKQTFGFTSGAGTSTTLQFSSNSAAGSNGGPTIDNVCVVAGTSACGSGTGGGSGVTGTTILTFDITGLSDGAFMPQAYGDNVTAPVMGTFSYGGQANTPDVTVEYRDGLTGPGSSSPNLTWYSGGFADLRNVLNNEDDGEAGFRTIFSAPSGVTLTINSFDMANFGSAVTLPSVKVIDANGTVVLNRTNVALPSSSGGHITFTGPWTGPSPLTLVIETTGLGGNSDNVGVDNISYSQTGGGAGSGGGNGGGGTGGGDGGAGNPPATTSGANCSYNVDKADPVGLPGQPAVGVALGFGFVDSGPGCKFAAYSPVSWVTVTPSVLTDVPVGSRGSWTYRIDANTGAQRQTILTVAGRQVTVVQLAGANTCQYALSSTSSAVHPFGGATGSVTVNVTGNPQCLVTAAIDPAVPAGQQFAQITSANAASGTGAKAFNYSVSLNNTTSARNIRLIVTGSNPTVTLNYTINQAAGPANTNPPPAINPGGGITNSASFIPGGPIAQGSFFSLFGTNMGPPNPGARATAYPLQTTLAGVSVAVTGGGRTVQALPLFVAEFQVNAIMPSNAPIGPVTVTVTYNGVAGSPQNANIVASAFGAFAVAAGRGPGIVQNALADGTRPLNSTITTTSRGSYVILWGTGLGPLAPTLSCGATVPDQCSPDTNYRPQVTSVQVFIGGVQANMQDQFAYAARAPGIAGVDQVQFPIPQNAPLGCYVPLQVVVNGTIYSNAVTLAISPPGQSCPEDYSASRFPREGGKNGSVILSRIAVNDPANPALSGTIDLSLGTFIQEPVGGPLGFNVFNSLPPSGVCTYYNNVNLDGVIGGQLPATAGAQNLDAGATITIRGPRGTQTMTYQTPASQLSPYQGLLGASGGLAALVPQPAFLDPGAYTVSGAGGRDVGPFTFDLNVGTAATLQNPPATIDRTRPLTLNWTGGNAANQEIYAIGYASDSAKNASGMFQCRIPIGAGTFAIPAGVLANLPAAQGQLIFMTMPQGNQTPSFTGSSPALDHGTAVYQVGSLTGVTFQ